MLALYDERATLECDCEGVVPTGRQTLSAYWEPKLDSPLETAFALDDMILTDCGVLVDYRGYHGKAVRIHLHLNPSGKILHTSCGLLGSRAA